VAHHPASKAIADVVAAEDVAGTAVTVDTTLEATTAAAAATTTEAHPRIIVTTEGMAAAGTTMEVEGTAVAADTTVGGVLHLIIGVLLLAAAVVRHTGPGLGATLHVN